MAVDVEAPNRARRKPSTLGLDTGTGLSPSLTVTLPRASDLQHDHIPR